MTSELILACVLLWLSGFVAAVGMRTYFDQHKNASLEVGISLISLLASMLFLFRGTT